MEKRNVIDRPARDRLIELLDRIARGEAKLGELRRERYGGEDETVGWIAEHFIADAGRLPLSIKDDRNKPSPRGLKEMERAIAFLRTDAELVPRRMAWGDYIVLACCAVFFIGAVIDRIDRLTEAAMNVNRAVAAVAGGIVIARLLAAYAIALGVAAVQIVRVRVLRHEISNVIPGDTWPFEVME